MAELRVGCSGWSYESWVGTFYPKGAETRRFLELYSRVFDVVEVNSTFYRIPKPRVPASWYVKTPDAFLFTAKMSRKVTHDARLRLPPAFVPLQQFFHSLRGLRDKLGCILIQLPPSLALDLPRLENFLNELKGEYRYAIEFRHSSWFQPKVMGLLRDYDVASCWSENQYLRTPPELTSDMVYLRFIGDRSLTLLGWLQKDRRPLMEEWYRKLRDALPSVERAFVFFNNHFTGFGPATVNQFRELAGLEPIDWVEAIGGGQRRLE